MFVATLFHDVCAPSSSPGPVSTEHESYPYRMRNTKFFSVYPIWRASPFFRALPRSSSLAVTPRMRAQRTSLHCDSTHNTRGLLSRTLLWLPLRPEISSERSPFSDADPANFLAARPTFILAYCAQRGNHAIKNRGCSPGFTNQRPRQE